MSIAPDPSSRTALYRHFDAAGTLLYVGISLSAVARLRSHQDESGWFGEIASVTIEWHDSRALAFAAERAAIKSERPRFNVIHNRPKRKKLAPIPPEIKAWMAVTAPFQRVLDYLGNPKSKEQARARLDFACNSGALWAGKVPNYPPGL